MLLYSVVWWYDSDLAKGKGRIKNHEHLVQFSVICRNSADAVLALHYHFYKVYRPSKGITIEDGQIELKRMKIDSRGFNANYLYMDGIREPLHLSDLKSNSLRLKQIFGI